MQKDNQVALKWRGILNERPEDMSYEDYKFYRKVQKNMIKKVIGPKLIWDSRRQGTFRGNINEALKQAELEQQLNNLKTKNEQD